MLATAHEDKSQPVWIKQSQAANQSDHFYHAKIKTKQSNEGQLAMGKHTTTTLRMGSDSRPIRARRLCIDLATSSSHCIILWPSFFNILLLLSFDWFYLPYVFLVLVPADFIVLFCLFLSFNLWLVWSHSVFLSHHITQMSLYCLCLSCLQLLSYSGQKQRLLRSRGSWRSTKIFRELQFNLWTT